MERVRLLQTKKVLSLEEIETGVFFSKVFGNADTPYNIELNINHPRKSKCNCPHADGRRVICKHIIATYFTVFPKEAEKFYETKIKYQEENERLEEELSDIVCDYILNKMDKKELQQELMQLLFEGPEWQYKRFVIDNGLDWLLDY